MINEPRGNFNNAPQNAMLHADTCLIGASLKLLKIQSGILPIDQS